MLFYRYVVEGCEDVVNFTMVIPTIRLSLTADVIGTLEVPSYMNPFGIEHFRIACLFEILKKSSKMAGAIAEVQKCFSASKKAAES